MIDTSTTCSSVILAPEYECTPTTTTGIKAKPKAERVVSMVRYGRNKPCRCGSGKKYKHCCLRYCRDRLMAAAMEAD